MREREREICINEGGGNVFTRENLRCAAAGRIKVVIVEDDRVYGFSVSAFARVKLSKWVIKLGFSEIVISPELVV